MKQECTPINTKTHFIHIFSGGSSSSSTRAIIVTGGSEYGSMLSSVEVLTPSGAPYSCSVPPLPSPRNRHTQDGAVACGGGEGEAATQTNCYSLTSVGWQKSHQLQKRRSLHSSWSSPAGLLLMGGYHSSTTTEILSATDSSSTFGSFVAYNTE